mmetsp:Transcript_19881/g.22180  ORF Transcript_19881/g.22180 Transcript_19881/m.22180 type:complete len:297 (-) Transcript_19881:20-910(-)
MSLKFTQALMISLIVSRRSIRAFTNGYLSRISQPSSIRLFNSDAKEKNRIDLVTEEEETPWNRSDGLPVNVRPGKRFRQHVNPLSRKFQMETQLPDGWPTNIFDEIFRPLHLDIGCGKGGFLLELAKERPGKNYLGLEIRPSVAEYAKTRVATHNLEGSLGFVGCNVNVDLERVLNLYQTHGGGPIDLVSIQFPDPHFKSSHNKRRVVTPPLVETLANFMLPGSVVFLQSDIQNVLDDMRLKFRESDKYFQDEIDDVNEYMSENYIGIPTEREISVIKRDLPVYRTIFRRTEVEFQ